MLIDLETRSEIDISRRGAYNYAEDSSTEILLIGYQTKPKGYVECVDLTKKDKKKLKEFVVNLEYCVKISAELRPELCRYQLESISLSNYTHTTHSLKD